MQCACGHHRPPRNSIQVPAKLFILSDGDWGEVSRANAGNKARRDMEEVLTCMGATRIVPDFERRDVRSGAISKLGGYWAHAAAIDRSLQALPPRSILFVQFPLVCHTPLFADLMHRYQKRGVRFALLLHDIEMMRFARASQTRIGTRLRIRVEERSALRQADCIVAHNDEMARRLVEMGVIGPGRVVSLGIFDYLCPLPPSWDLATGRRALSRRGPVVVAGNLSLEKAGYLYQDLGSMSLALYGAGYAAGPRPLVEYRGEVPPQVLPDLLEGSFGLVWDGPSADSCTGAFGEYLRVNNPHKTSLYLAAGMPVILWDKAALAPFVSEHGVGICIARLSDIPSMIERMGDEEYGAMAVRAATLGRKIRQGRYTKAAAAKAIRLIEDGGVD